MTSLLSQGGELMMMGMGAVFVFLVLLVIVTTLMSSIVNRLFPEKPLVTAAVPLAATTEADPQLLAVIQQAIQQHRTRRK